MMIMPAGPSGKISKRVARKPSHRIQLRSRDWLNIMIISVSAMFLLLVLIGKMLTETESRTSQTPAIEDIQLLRIDFGTLQLVKKGDGWVEESGRLKSARAQRIGRSWQDLLAQPSNKVSNTKTSGETLLFYFSHIEQPVVVKLVLSSDAAKAVFVASQVEYPIAREAIEQYMPRETKTLTQE